MRRLPALLVALALVAGCSASPASPSASPSAAPSGSAPAAGGVELAIAHGVARLPLSAGAATSAGEAVDAFGLDLYGRLRAQPGNLVFSPASVALALSMARAGARGTTAAEMDAVLHGLASDAHADWIASLDQALAARTGTFADRAGDPQPVTLRIANGGFAQRGLALEPACLQALAARFGAGVGLVDYIAAPDAARQAINGWVADQTEQRIRDLLAPGSVTDDTRLVLANAIYLKAAWLVPFEPDATADGPFRRADGTAATVRMMHTRGRLRYAAGAGWQAVELPYVGGQLAMLAIVPDSLAAFEPQLDAPTLASITAALAPREVSLGLPRFGTETRADLNAILAAMGMPSAFSPTAADFSGITAQAELFISRVVHQANIDVDERGTEAAAATAVVMDTTALPSDTVTLNVDRPFIFAVRDLETGAVLFLGRIADPSAGPSGG